VTATTLAPGKTNLCLFLGPTRADGRHELVSVMQSLTFGDDVALGPASGGADEVVCPGVDGDNLALDALRAFRAATGWDGPPQRIEIAKRVPIAAGMGGGSGDAAAVLRLAHAASGLGDDALLHELAAALGADVPAQVSPGRVLATGAGEVVERLPDPAPYGVLVLPSHHRLSTPDVFREADRMGIPRDPDDLAQRLADVREFGADLPDALIHNDLEAAARSLLPEIGRTLYEAIGAGADRAFVSGSGPTVIGLFADRDAGREAAERLAHRDPPPAYAEPFAAADTPAAESPAAPDPPGPAA
jgi:4-diphosphocytidyl-2-C-methyl-D-erythritol kinase